MTGSKVVQAGGPGEWRAVCDAVIGSRPGSAFHGRALIALAGLVRETGEGPTVGLVGRTRSTHAYQIEVVERVLKRAGQ